MAKNIYNAIMSGKSDNNIRFADIQDMLNGMGFGCRIKGDHFIYYRDDIPDLINIQPDGNKTKPYQVKQIRLLFRKYDIKGR